VRVLCTFVGGTGHAEPIVPVARALRDAGHTVAFAGHVDPVAHLDFETIVTSGTPGTPPERRPLVEPDQAGEERVIRDHFAGSAARSRIDRYRSVFAEWKPDLVIRDEVDFGAAVLTEALGIPHAVVVVLAAGGFLRPAVVADPLSSLRASLDLPADPAWERLWRGMVLSPFAPSLRDPAHPLPPGTYAFSAWRPPARSPAVRPRVYVTLGTVFPLESGDLFARLLAGIAALPVDVVATTGRDVDPAELGPQPPNVQVARWLPQASVLPAVDLVVHHGGSGTLAAASAHGLPQVVIAMGADQMLNARRVTALGLGRALHPTTVTPAEARDAVATVLADPTARRAATTLADEYAALPDPAGAVPPLEALAVSRYG
jgi:UDP:flavonoid glycosyltransferase YjiC (YdhE family)